MLKFQDKTVVVTGSGTGIGQAISIKFAENGASLVLLGRRREPLEETSKQLQQIIEKVGSNATVRIYPGTDVSDEQSITEMFQDLGKNGDGVDIVVNNAGVSGPVTCFTNSPMQKFRETVAIHLSGTFWTSAEAIKAMKQNSKIVTIATFFTEERPHEQRPYRFRTPYTAAQGAKNRLVELMSWELAEKNIVSIATNPGPVHSDRIYKTVYPKAAAEFLRVTGFEDLTPQDVEMANNEILDLLGESEDTINQGLEKAAEKVASNKEKDPKNSLDLKNSISNLLNNIQTIAEKVQKNTSKMIVDGQFLGQDEVADTVLTLCDDKISKTLNGRVVPGDGVFYSVKPNVGCTVPDIQSDFNSKTVVLTSDAQSHTDFDRLKNIVQKIQEEGGKVIVIGSKNANNDSQSKLKEHNADFIDLTDPSEVKKAFEKIIQHPENNKENLLCLHYTGDLPEIQKIIELKRKEWDNLVDKFINIPANVSQQFLNTLFPGSDKDPRKIKEQWARIAIIGPSYPVGKKIPVFERAKVDVFRGGLRPLVATINQELSDALKSKARVFLLLPGSVDGSEPQIENITKALKYLISEESTSSSEVILYSDEKR